MYVRPILVLAVSGVLLLQGCTVTGQGWQAREGSPGAGLRHKATGLVRDGPARGAMLCLGGLPGSYPPYPCGTVPLRGWDWNDVSGEESSRGVTWGSYRVVGTYDGTSFTVFEAGPPRPPNPGTLDPLATPCAEPEGGWKTTDPARTDGSHKKAAWRLAESEPGFGGLWWDHPYEEPGDPTNRGPRVLNVGFTSNVASLRQELGRLWGGPLCVTRFDYTYRELNQIQEELNEVVEEHGLDSLWSDIPLAHNHVELGVVAIDSATQSELAARYENALRVIPAIRPVRRTS
jgi:hypothetical protein